MKSTETSAVTTTGLVQLFAKIGVAQDEALLGGETAKFNRLYDQMTAVSDEMKRRDGDQRRALQSLYSSENMQVRLKAAIHTLAAAPVEARKLLEAVAVSKWFPQAGDAGMMLLALDDGTYRPGGPTMKRTPLDKMSSADLVELCAHICVAPGRGKSWRRNREI